MTKKLENQNNEKRRAIFLDRDGVINRAIIREGKPYPPSSLEEFEILPGVDEACTRIKKAGYLLIVATNQPDVGRGTLPKDLVEEMHSSLLKQLPIDKVEVCYHPGRGKSNCHCRKPLPGMLVKAAVELGIDLKRSWMIGDRGTDIECGYSAGCTTILIGDGYNEAFKIKPNFRVRNLVEAVTIILG